MKTLNFTLTLLLATLTTSVFATQNKNTVKLRLQSVTTAYLDETTVFFDEQIAPTYNSSEDAAKVFNNVQGVPAIYSYTSENIKVSNNGFGTLATSEIVPLGYKVSVSGMYKIIASNVSNFDGTSVIRLEDRELGTFTDMRANFYQVQLDTQDAPAGRFFIHVSRPVQFSSTNSGCANNDGIINVKFDNSIVWDMVQVADASNNPINSYANINYSEVNFNSLSEGDYNVTFIFGSYATTRTFHLTGNHVVASIAAPAQAIVKGQEVTFNANAHHATDYHWNFGEGTEITGVANPSTFYLQTGDFTVNLSCSNQFGCSASAQLNVSVATTTGIDEQTKGNINIFANNKNVIVNLNEIANSSAQVTVFNLLGASVYTNNFSSQKETINMDAQQNGYYIVSVKNAGQTTTSRVFISK